MTPIWIVFVLSINFFTLGHCQSPPKKESPRPFSVCLGFSSEDEEVDSLEAHYETKGGLFVVWGDQLYNPRPDQRVWKGATVPAEETTRYYTGAKYRFGHWYKRVKGQILRHGKGGWAPLLEPSTYFAQFEILEDGQVLLVCTGHPTPGFKIPRLPWTFGQRDMQSGTANLLETWDPRSGVMTHAVPYPDELHKLNGRWLFRGICGVERTLRVGDHLLLHWADLGQLWSYDLSNQRLRRIALPWQGIDEDRLSRAAAQMGVQNCDGCVEYESGIFAPSLHFYPAGPSEVFLVASSTLPTRRHIAPREAALLKQGRRYLHPDRVYSEEESRTEQAVQGYRLDLTTGSVKRFPIDMKSRPRMPWNAIWVDGTETIKPLTTLTRLKEKPTTPKPAEPAKGQDTKVLTQSAEKH